MNTQHHFDPTQRTQNLKHLPGLNKSIVRFILLLFIFAIATPALADYLGPDRTTTESHVETYDYGVWVKPDPTGTSCTHKYGTACIVCTWERKPGNPCGDAEYSYKLGTKSEVVTTTTNLPPATISGSLQNCTLQNGWCITAPRLSLSANEPLSGYNILAIEGTLNGQSFACSAANCTIPLNEGNNNFAYWALSSWGDSSSMGMLNAKVDSRPPNITGSFTGTLGSNNWYITPLSFAGSASDATSGLASFSCTLDGAALGSCNSINVDTDGPHTVVLTARDNAGQTATITQNASLDTQNPDLSAALGGTLGSNNWYTTATIDASASDPTPGSGLAALQYDLDATGWVTFPASGALTPPDGKYNLNIRAVDLAGRTVSSSKSFWLDSTAPSVAPDPAGTSGLNGWYTSDLDLSATASDATSGVDTFEYSLDGGVWEAYTAPLLLTDGTHNLSFWAQDSAGLVTQVDRIYKVDTRPPQIGGSLSGVPGANGWYISDVTLSASVADPTPGSGTEAFTYILNGGAETPYTSALTFSDGLHTVQFNAQDKAGLAHSTEQTIKVDTIPPSLNVQSTLPNWIRNSVTLNGSSGDSGSGLSKVEISTDGGQTWQLVNGVTSWGYTWNTQASLNGIRDVYVRATDNAGLATKRSFSTGVDNHGPKISLPDSWYQWDTVTLDIWDDDSGLSEARVEISDPDGRWPARIIRLDPGRFPLDFKWDRRFADGTIAPLGTYEAKVIAFDHLDNRTDKSASINILLGVLSAGPTSTPQPASRPTSTLAPTQIATPTAVPTQTAIVSVFGALEPTTEMMPTVTAVSTPRAAPPQTNVLDWLQSIFSPNPDAVETTTEVVSAEPLSATHSPDSKSSVLWGAAAAGVIGAATAYALEENRKRKEAEAQQAAAAEKKAAQLNAAEEARKVQSWLEGQAILNAQLDEAKRQGASTEQISAIKQMGATQGLGAAIGKAANLTESLYNAIVRRAKSLNQQRKEALVEEEMQAYGAKPQEWETAYNQYMAQKAIEAQNKKESVEDSVVTLPEKSWWENAKSFVQENIIQPTVEALDRNIYKPYIQPNLTPQKIISTVLLSVLGIQGLQWVNNVVTNPQIFLPVQARAESLIEGLRAKYPPSPENLTFDNLFAHPYDALSQGAGVLETFTNIAASYADAIWQQNPLVQAQIEALESLESAVCPGISNQAWSNRCTAAFYLPAGLNTTPFDTAVGVINSFMVDPVTGFIKQAALSLENVEALPDFISAINEGGLKGAQDFMKDMFKKNLDIFLNDKQVQSALFFEGLTLLALLAAPVAGGVILGMTASGLISIDSSVTSASDKKTVIDLITGHDVRTTVVSSFLALAMITVGLGKQVGGFRSFQESLSPTAQTSFAELSLLEQTRIADLAIKMKLSPEAMEFYLTESALPGSPLANLSLTDALRVSSLLEVYGEETLTRILPFCEKYGMNPYEVLTRPRAEGQSPFGLILGIESPENPVNHPLVKLNLTKAELNNILTESLKNPDSKVFVLGYGNGSETPYYILADKINGSFLSVSIEVWEPFENARANFFMDINAPAIEMAIEQRKIFLFNVEYDVIINPRNAERFSLPELRLIELEKNNYVQVPVGKYTALIPFELLDTYQQYLDPSLLISGE